MNKIANTEYVYLNSTFWFKKLPRLDVLTGICSLLIYAMLVRTSIDYLEKIEVPI